MPVMRFSLSLRLIQIVSPLLFLGLAVSAPLHAQTLHERSLQQLSQRLEGVSPDNFSFIVMGDSRDGDEIFKKNLLTAKLYNPLFILHNGDVAFTGTEARIQNFLNIIQSTVPDVPVFVVMGNHDLTDNRKTLKGKEKFQEMIAPLDYVLDFPKQGMKLIILDNSLYKLTPEQLQYLERELSPGRKINVVTMHIPPKTERWSRHSFSEGAPEMIRILSDKKVSLAFYSHIHLYDEDVIQNVKSYITGGAGAPLYKTGYTGDPIHHFLLIRVHKGNVTTSVIRLQE